MLITLAKREQIKPPILVTGASGSGKTVSSIVMAKGIVDAKYPDLDDEDAWKKIAVIDTEHERSKYYADTTVANIKIGEFYHGAFEPPYTVKELEKGIQELKEKGVEVVVLDSLSHLWSGEGGIQDSVDKIQSKYPKAGFTAWGKVKPQIDELLRVLTANSVFIICTARSKTGYDMEKNANGKTIPVKVGLKPEIRDGWEYEFAINFNINQDHSAEAIKDNTNMFSDVAPITEDTGKQIYEWSTTGIDPEEERRNLIMEVEELAQEDDLKRQKTDALIKRHGNLNGWNRAQLKSAKSYLEGLEVKQKRQPVSQQGNQSTTTAKENDDLDSLLANAK